MMSICQRTHPLRRKDRKLLGAWAPASKGSSRQADCIRCRTQACGSLVATEGPAITVPMRACISVVCACTPSNPCLPWPPRRVRGARKHHEVGTANRRRGGSRCCRHGARALVGHGPVVIHDPSHGRGVTLLIMYHGVDGIRRTGIGWTSADCRRAEAQSMKLPIALCRVRPRIV